MNPEEEQINPQEALQEAMLFQSNKQHKESVGLSEAQIHQNKKILDSQQSTNELLEVVIQQNDKDRKELLKTLKRNQHLNLLNLLISQKPQTTDLILDDSVEVITVEDSGEDIVRKLEALPNFKEIVQKWIKQ